MPEQCLACDLGAESGRLVIGRMAPETVEMEEIHRFENRPVRRGDSLCWDVEALWEGLMEGLGKAAGLGEDIRSISCDSWGVDYVLWDGEGRILEPVRHYRDGRCARGMERVLERISWPEIFAETGIQQMPINTLYQLGAEPPGRLAGARRLLGVGDAFNHMLGGRPVSELSLASTFQLLDPRTRKWSPAVCAAAGIPPGLLPEVVEAGTRIGTLAPEVRERTGLGPIAVVAGCSHDTAAAVAAAPLAGRGSAYLSSGTWSLLGVERREPILDQRCRDLNFTNEIGAGGSIRLLKNLAGLWPLQECRRQWAARGRERSYGTLAELAAEAPPLASVVDLGHPSLSAPEDMPRAIAGLCRASGQAEPGSDGAVARCILESLALLYARTLDELEELGGEDIGVLNVVGGGSRNDLLNQLAAEASGRTVEAGPVEAAALGNLGIQAVAAGELPDLAAIRALSGRDRRRFVPRGGPGWEEARERFRALAGS